MFATALTPTSAAQALWGMSQKAQCTTGRYKYLAIHMHEPARQRAGTGGTHAAFASAQRKRKKVEALFAELKNLIGYVAAPTFG